MAALVAAADQLDWEAWFSMLELPQALRQQEAQLAALFDEADEFILKQLVELDVALNQPQQLAWFLAAACAISGEAGGQEGLGAHWRQRARWSLPSPCGWRSSPRSW